MSERVLPTLSKLTSQNYSRQYEEYIFAIEKNMAHPANIFKDLVLQLSADDYNVFVMTDQAAVARAVLQGAVRLTETVVESTI